MDNKKAQIGIFLLVILGIGLLIGGVYLVKYWLLPVHVTTAQIDSAHDIIDKTYKADNAIYNYEWFKTQYEKIQANRNQIQNLKDSLASYKETYGNVNTWDYVVKEEYNRLNTMYIGLQNQDENLVAEYNARSKMANRNIFDDKLPMNVDKMLR
jgi:hypothetical protein